MFLGGELVSKTDCDKFDPYLLRYRSWLKKRYNAEWITHEGSGQALNLTSYCQFESGRLVYKKSIPENRPMSDEKDNLGSRVKHLRETLGISEQELADTVDLTLDRLRGFEAGSHSLGRTTTKQIVKALDFTTELYDLLGEPEPIPSPADLALVYLERALAEIAPRGLRHHTSVADEYAYATRKIIEVIAYYKYHVTKI